MKSYYDEVVDLKNLVRTGWSIRFGKENGRLETDAEHIFSCIMLAIKIINNEQLELNQEKVMKMLLYHEIGEIDVGDIPVIDTARRVNKYELEKKAVTRFANTHKILEIVKCWEEFEEGKTKEAKFCKIIDKLDTVLQAKKYSEKYNKPEVYAEFYENAKNLIKGYEKYLEL